MFLVLFSYFLLAFSFFLPFVYSFVRLASPHRSGGAGAVGKVARDRRSGRPSGSAPGGGGGGGGSDGGGAGGHHGGGGENGGGGGGAVAGAAPHGPRKSVRPRPVDMHKPLSVLRADEVRGAALRIVSCCVSRECRWWG